MILYHGSYTKVETPDLKHSRNNVDLVLVLRYSNLRAISKMEFKFKKRGKDSFISSFEFTQDKLSSLNVMKFDDYSESWLDFILRCRSGQDTINYDLVIGGVANDKVFNTVELFLMVL